MGWWKRIAKGKQKKCLTCGKMGVHKAKVKYSYNGGHNTAPICNSCAKTFDIVADAFEDDEDETV